MAASGPELDLELLTMRKGVVAVPKGMHTPMCYCGEIARLSSAMLSDMLTGCGSSCAPTMRMTQSSH
jgi:hypothetical protein